MQPAELQIVEIDAAATHDLRRRVLRDGTPTDEVDFAEDHLPGVFHLGAFADGLLIGISTWVPRDFAGAPGAVQLRGMATEPALRGHGVGGRLVAVGVARLAADGVPVVWARARDAALDFYLRHGFEVRGDGFVDATTELPHHLVIRMIDEGSS